MKAFLVTFLSVFSLASCSKNSLLIHNDQRKPASQYFTCKVLYANQDRKIVDEVSGLDIDFPDTKNTDEIKIHLNSDFANATLDGGEMEIENLNLKNLEMTKDPSCPAYFYDGFVRMEIKLHGSSIKRNNLGSKLTQEEKQSIPLTLSCHGERVSNSCY